MDKRGIEKGLFEENWGPNVRERVSGGLPMQAYVKAPRLEACLSNLPPSEKLYVSRCNLRREIN